MVRWLEANGYDVSYFTGVDSDRRGNLIADHALFLSVGHDEYWSGAQRRQRRNRPQCWRPFGLFQWQRDLLEDALGEQYRRVATRPIVRSVCYKETHANAKIDPLGHVVDGDLA